MGISLDLSIRRFRTTGHLDFKTDDFLSPWGQLVRGDDGNYYPLGMKSKVRVKFVSDQEIQAFLENGSQFTFGKEQVIQTPSGIYAWYLVEARNDKNQVSRYEYLALEDSFLYLNQVFYGGSETNPQYRIGLSYEVLPHPFLDYRSTIAQRLQKRVSQVSFEVKAGGGFSPRFAYYFDYDLDEISPTFYLKSLEKRYASGSAEPKRVFEFSKISDFLNQAKWKSAEKFNPILAQYGNRILDRKETTFYDSDSNGLTSIELAYRDHAVIRQGIEQFSFEPRLPMLPEVDHFCRSSIKRRILRMRGPQAPLEVVVFYSPPDAYPTRTQIHVCNLDGFRTGYTEVPGDWTYASNRLLVDLDGDGKPELIRLLPSGKYEILRNISTLDRVEFVQTPIKKSLQEELYSHGFVVQDMNGDGIPDLVGLDKNGFRVWYGKGNYEFDSHSVFMCMRDKSMPVYDEKIFIEDKWQIDFQDLNQDGMMDLVIYGSNFVSTFLSDGKSFIKRSIPALAFKELPFAQSLKELGIVPAFTDLSGSGNPQLVVAEMRQAHILELADASIGLLKKVDDGKGNVLEFEYARISPEKGLGKRPAVLSQMKVHRAGKADQVYQYHYQGGVNRTDNLSLIGFSEIQVDQEFHKTTAKFHQDDVTSPTLDHVHELDPRQQGVFRVTDYDYEKTSFHGIAYPRLLKESSGWESQGKTAVKTKFYKEYQNEFCPSRTQEVTGGFILDTTLLYQTPQALTESLGCFAGSIQLSGQHQDPRQNFSHDLQIVRDALGHPLKLWSNADGGRILQTLTYRDDFRILSIEVPGKGKTVFDYDSSYRLAQITPADGVTIQANYLPMDLLSSLSTWHGEGGVFTQGFGYDGFERLSAEWNNLVESSEAFPLEQFQYQYAKENQPGWIEAATRLLSQNQPIWKKQIGLQSSDGKEMGSAVPGDSGWVLKGLKLVVPQAGQTLTFQSRVLGGSPQGVPTEVLYSGLTAIEDEVSTSLGLPLSKSVVYQNNQKGNFLTSAHIISGEWQGELELAQTENTAFTTVQRKNPDDKKTSYQDEQGQATSYQYDALGRLSQVTLANGDQHKISYDGQGRVSLIERASIGKISIQYVPGTDLVQTKFYSSLSNLVDHRVDFEYDEKGRITRQTHAHGGGGMLGRSFGGSQVYSYYYDGNLPPASATAIFSKAEKMSGQVGFLTAVQGHVFTRIMKYRVDGKLASQELRVPLEPTLVESFQYQADGSLFTSTVEVQDPQAQASCVRAHQEYVLDSLGRLAQIKVGNALSAGSSPLAPFATLSYNEFSQIHQVALSSDEQLGFEYDPVTRKLREVNRTRANIPTSKNKWAFNDRGLIEWEQFGVGEQTLSRTYGYSPNASLITDQDELEQRKYSFDSVGMMTQFDQGNQSTQIQSDLNQWRFQTGEQTSRYELDSLGRVIKSAVKTADEKTTNAEFKYGPHGRVESIKKADGTLVSYHYDETGKRIAKAVNGKITETYFGNHVVTNGHVYQPFKLGGVAVGVLEDAKFISLATDFKGSVLQDKTGKMDVPTAFGERKAERTEHASVIDYVAQGYDPDLRAYRMEQRDYDPVAKRFLTPDPLFLEDPEKCVDSPKECNLYGYAAGNPVSFVDPSGLWSLSVGVTAGGGAGIGGYITPIGFTISYSQEHGLMGALFSNAGHTTHAGPPGGSYGVAITFSPCEQKLENGSSTSLIHGAELKTPVGGLGLDHSTDVKTGEHSYTLTIGKGMIGEYHTGIEHQITFGATQLTGGTASPTGSYTSSGNAGSTHLLEANWTKNSSSNGAF